MKTVKKIVGILIGLFVAYLVLSFLWGILNMQTCTSNLSENPTCEQIAKDTAENCSYIILRWKKVDYNKVLSDCREWEAKQNNNL